MIKYYNETTNKSMEDKKIKSFPDLDAWKEAHVLCFLVVLRDTQLKGSIRLKGGVILK